MRICIPIVAETGEEALRKMGRPLPEDRLLEIIFELRMDRMKGVNLQRILREKKKKIVVTNRRREEGGGFQGTEKERIAVIREAVILGADYVDIEASTDHTLLMEAKALIAAHGHKTMLIVSFHDFEKTPSERMLRQKLGECVAWAPDIVKIASRANTDEDNLKSLSLLPYARKNGQAIISFCMGEKGKISRVMSLLLGAYMGFASLREGEESAPGQFSIAEMLQVLGALNGESRRVPGKGRIGAGKEILGV